MEGHLPVLLREILEILPESSERAGHFLDVTAGGGGHFVAVLKQRPQWQGECWDRDPLAEPRLQNEINKNSLGERAVFFARSFGDGQPANRHFRYDFILADLGVSSFQLDDRSRGMSLFSDVPPDFRMNPCEGAALREWIAQTPLATLEMILEEFGEEPRAKKLAQAMKSWNESVFSSAKIFADQISATLKYQGSRIHPATRTFQALRIAINDEMGELRRLLSWAPNSLVEGGRLAIISFHSIEDRIVKNAFRDLASQPAFDILYKKPLEATEEERAVNPRSRSAKLRVLHKC